jgi:phage terminase large subunit-like protein
LPLLEDQMTAWDPASDVKSPDRVDALVYALTELSGSNRATEAPPRPIITKNVRTAGW